MTATVMPSTVVGTTASRNITFFNFSKIFMSKPSPALVSITANAICLAGNIIIMKFEGP